ncbi:hypothetical protein C0992_007268 [Termitomyces sp. T32_za158]|nr:hypothetical protein C0992_007268 [Termitomyces sp. T32_za158]
MDKPHDAATPSPAPAPAPQPNPWSDADNPKSEPLHTPDPSTMDQSIVHGLESVVLSAPTDNRPPQVSQEVLDQFDPLASLEEEAAREAWQAAEAHPPQPQPPVPPLKDNAPSSPPDAGTMASSSFPSFTALARTFAMPTFSRPRPLSVDQAQPVPSPATLSATLMDTPRNDNDASRLSPSGSGTPQGEIPFDFQKFLDQMKSRNAEPVSKYLRSFLSNFAKRTFTVNDQVKIINDFLIFISGQMRACDPWKTASDTEFDNAMEGMEKLVMNRLYDFTFTPQVAVAVPPRPITADDLERDRVLSQRIALFGWIAGRHLDLLEGEGSAGFLLFAQQELLKINQYKAPRDKLICILNCCKVIYGLIRHLQADESADAFVPILIYVVLKANPEHLLSNIEFISRFRNPEKLQSEAGYYLSSLIGAVSFIETMDHTSLSNISQEEFEQNVEDAIQGLPQSETSSPVSQAPATQTLQSPPPLHPTSIAGDAQPLAMSTPVHSLSGDARRLLQRTGDTISRPLNAIGRIFSDALDGADSKLAYIPGPFAPFELGREGREQGAAAGAGAGAASVGYSEGDGRGRGYQVPQTASAPTTTMSMSEGVQTPYKPRVRGAPSTSPLAPDDAAYRLGPPTSTRQPPYGLLSPVSPRVQTLAGTAGTVGAGAGDGHSVSRTPTPNLDFDFDLAEMSRQIDVAHEQAAAAARETLVQIFPGVDGEVVELVLEAQSGDLGKSIEALLEMSVGS